MRRRRAFTLIEALVASLLALMLLAVIALMTRFGARSIAGVEGHLDAMHAALACLERVEMDLDRLLVWSATDLSVFDGGAVQPGQKLEFTIAEPGPGKKDPLYVGTAVSYAARSVGDGVLELLRNGAPVAGGRFKSITFSAREYTGLDPARPLHLVRTTLVAVGATGQELRLESLTAVDPVTEWSRGRDFNPNPDSTWPVLALKNP